MLWGPDIRNYGIFTRWPDVPVCPSDLNIFLIQNANNNEDSQLYLHKLLSSNLYVLAIQVS